MKKPRSHKQTIVQVNALVDSGIEELVSALNDEFSYLYTESSCEGGAFVTFRLNLPIPETMTFFYWLSRHLIRVAHATVTAQWGGGKTLLCTLRCQPCDIPAVTHIIRTTSPPPLAQVRRGLLRRLGL